MLTTFMSACTCTYMYAKMHIHVCIYIRIMDAFPHNYIHASTHAYTLACLTTYIHTYIHGDQCMTDIHKDSHPVHLHAFIHT